jgi:hypothetical protein
LWRAGSPAYLTVLHCAVFDDVIDEYISKNDEGMQGAAHIMAAGMK